MVIPPRTRLQQSTTRAKRLPRDRLHTAHMISLSAIPSRLFSCPEGFLFYDRDAAWLHTFNATGLLAWNLTLCKMESDSVSRFLTDLYGLAQTPLDDVEAIVSELTRVGLVAAETSGARNGALELDEEQLWAHSSKAVEQARTGEAWETPSLTSFPLDALKVTSAKCSSRWANLDDNTCYQPASAGPRLA